MDINTKIAIKGAELFGIELHVHDAPFVYYYDEKDPEHWYGDRFNPFVDAMVFDPANNANDMNKLIEALKINVMWCEGSERWRCSEFKRFLKSENESRDEAIRECVIKALGLHKDSGALGVDND